MKSSVSLLVGAVAFATLCGCASAPVVSRAMLLKPANGSKGEWFITGKAENGPYTGYLTFYINGKEVAKGELNQVTPRKTISWTYEGEKIEAECSLTREHAAMVYGHDCTIYRKGKSVTELKF